MNACKKVAAGLVAGTLLAAQALGIVIAAGLIPLGFVAAADRGDRLGRHLVGHAVMTIDVVDTFGAPRNTEFLLWYPADRRHWKRAKPSVYTSRLHGVPLLPGTWDPLAFEVVSDVARDARVHRHGRYPVIIFSHGASNDAIEYAYTMEHLASHGYVVASGRYPGNNQDDARTDLVNRTVGSNVLPCLDGNPPPCFWTPPATNESFDLPNRAIDYSAAIDALGAYFGDRVDLDHVGMFGPSRGTASVLISAGGSTPRGILPETRVKAVAGMAIANLAATSTIDLANISVPVLLMAGQLDANTPASTSVMAFNTVSSKDKALLVIKGGHHRSFDSTFCDQMQSAAGIAQSSPTALLENNLLTQILVSPGTSGSTIDYCSYESFTRPVDIRPLVQARTGFVVTETSVPRAGVDSDEVTRIAEAAAVTFFDAVLKRKRGFERRLGRLFEDEAEGITASCVAGWGAVNPQNLGFECSSSERRRGGD